MSAASGLFGLDGPWRAPGRLLRRRATATAGAQACAHADGGVHLMAVLQPQIERQGSLVVHLVGVESGCGTTRVTGSLARAAARHDWCRVLVVDATMLAGHGQPTGPALLGLHKATGSVPSVHATEGFVQTLPLTSGRLVPRPGELRALYASLRQQFSLVLVDCPPVLSAPDTAILSALADRTILVVRAERSRALMVAQAKRLLEQAGVERLGAVLNGERRRVPRVVERLL